MGTGTGAIRSFAEVTGLTYSHVDRVSRYLREGRWPHRGDAQLRPYHLASLITALSSQQANDAFETAEAVDKLQPVRIVEHLSLDPNEAGCSRQDALLVYAPGSNLNLTQFIADSIHALTGIGEDQRRELAERLTAAGWHLTICLAPLSTTITWREAAPEAGGAIKLCSFEWAPDRRGLAVVSDPTFERHTTIPFRVITAAAEAYLAARPYRKTLPVPAPGSAGAGGNGHPGTTEAARAGTAGGLLRTDQLPDLPSDKALLTKDLVMLPAVGKAMAKLATARFVTDTSKADDNNRRLAVAS